MVSTISKVVAAILAIAMMCGVTYLICKLIKWLSKSTRAKEHPPQVVAKNNDSILQNDIITNNKIQSNSVSCEVKPEAFNPPVVSEQTTKETSSIDPIETPKDFQPSIEYVEDSDAYYTLYELAMCHDFESGCMTATNDENPDLKWVKIYKPCYGNGKFYGYVMMNNAHHSVNGEIYFANRPIWYLV